MDCKLGSLLAAALVEEVDIDGPVVAVAVVGSTAAQLLEQYLEAEGSNVARILRPYSWAVRLLPVVVDSSSADPVVGAWRGTSPLPEVAESTAVVRSWSLSMRIVVLDGYRMRKHKRGSIYDEGTATRKAWNLPRLPCTPQRTRAMTSVPFGAIVDIAAHCLRRRADNRRTSLPCLRRSEEANDTRQEKKS